MRQPHRKEAISTERAPPRAGSLIAAVVFAALAAFPIPEQSLADSLLEYHLQRSDIECLINSRAMISASLEDPIILGLGKCPLTRGVPDLPAVDSFPTFTIEDSKYNRIIVIPKKAADCYFQKLSGVLGGTDPIITIDFAQCG
jgi:hypothetical protein